MGNIRGSVCVCLSVALWCNFIHAGGWEVPENGSRALARGGAFVARADDPSAVVLNPAGLAKQRGLQLWVDGNLLWQNLCYQKSGIYPGTAAADSYAGQSYPEVCRDSEAPFVVPLFAITYDFGLPDWTFAVSVNFPHAVGQRKFPILATVEDKNGNAVEAPTPTRYHLEEVNSIVGYGSVAAAWRPVDWLQVGAALQAVYGQVQFATWIPLVPGGDYQNEIRLSLDTNGWTATGLVGLLAKPLEGLHLGLSARLPYTIASKGNAEIELDEALDDSISWHGGKPRADLPIRFPLVVRSGVRYAWDVPDTPDAPPLWDVELNVIWENWSIVETLDVTVNADLYGRTLPEYKLNHFYDDVLSLRLGGSFTLPQPLWGGWLSFDVGTHYSNSASPLNYTRLDYEAWARVGLHGGIGFEWNGIEVLASAAHIWTGTGEMGQPWTFTAGRHVDQSCVQPIDPLWSEKQVICDPLELDATEHETDISRGAFTGSYTIVSLGLRIRFEALGFGR